MKLDILCILSGIHLTASKAPINLTTQSPEKKKRCLFIGRVDLRRRGMHPNNMMGGLGVNSDEALSNSQPMPAHK